MLKKILITLLPSILILSGCDSSGSSDMSNLAALLLLSSSSSSNNCSASTSNSPSTTTTTGNYTVVDTNQTSCYDENGTTVSCSGTGYDGAYTGNSPSYTTSGSGNIITDNNTGLMWTQSTNINSDSTIDYDDKMYQSEAVTYCENLELDGYSDWRLPDVKTAYSLILFSGKDASTVADQYDSSVTSSLTPFIDSAFDWAFGDTTAGDRIIDAQYASTSNYEYTTMTGDSTMFGVNYVDGRIKGYPCETKKFYVRCVRGNEDYGLNNFTNNSDGTVSDSSTGLMWYQADTSSTSWQNAVSICEGDTTTGSHSDWRLPNAKELQSILDYSRSPDTTSSAAINAVFNATSFTNENGQTDYGYYWSSTTHLDNDNDATNAVYVSFGRADGYMNGTSFLDVHGAGSQRSNDKKSESADTSDTANLGYGSFYYHGPQGDIVRIDNKVLCVRDI